MWWRQADETWGLVCLAEVMKYGYIVLIPFGERRRYDMVIYNRKIVRLEERTLQ